MSTNPHRRNRLHAPTPSVPRSPGRRPKPDREIPVSRLIGRGLVKHCPRCGQGKLFRRWFTMVDTCPGCGLSFEREPGWILGAMTINTAWTLFVILVTMFAGFVITYPDIDAFWVSVTTGIAAMLAVLIGYPFSKTVWIAIDLAMVPDPVPATEEHPDQA